MEVDEEGGGRGIVGVKGKEQREADFEVEVVVVEIKEEEDVVM